MEILDIERAGMHQRRPAGQSFLASAHARDRVLGLADDYAVDTFGNNSPEVHAAWSKVVRLCSRIREQTETVAP